MLVVVVQEYGLALLVMAQQAEVMAQLLALVQMQQQIQVQVVVEVGEVNLEELEILLQYLHHKEIMVLQEMEVPVVQLLAVVEVEAYQLVGGGVPHWRQPYQHGLLCC